MEMSIRTWSCQISSLGDLRFILKYPILIVLEQYNTQYSDRYEVVAGYPETESWAGGNTEIEAINKLKDEMIELCEQFLLVSKEEQDKFEKLSKRRLMALQAMIIFQL